MRRREENVIKKIIRFFLCIIIPKANPDFEYKIRLVSFWLLEFTDEASAPTREIGLGKNDNVIMKMLYKKNYGYWTDNNLTYYDFRKSFEVEHVTKEYFEDKWNNL